MAALLLLVIAAAGFLFGAVDGIAASAHGPDAPKHLVKEVEPPLAAWARKRFSLAGLELPDIELTVNTSKTSCDGNSGLTRTGGPTAIIDICLESDAPDIAVRRVVLHEFAHAWAAATLDDAARAAFAALRQTTSWDSGTWEDRASEQAADIMAWGLIDRPLRVIIPGPCEQQDLTAAFRALCGHQPISPNAS